jgi:ABC-type microcin C transport system duplicated ATPase subunit YejF
MPSIRDVRNEAAQPPDQPQAFRNPEYPVGATAAMTGALLRVENLSAGFRQGGEMIRAADEVSFHIDAGETFALVGESGSGKSVTALSVLRLLPRNGRILGGRVFLDGADLLRMSELALSGVRGRRIGVIFQDPLTALNPVMTVGAQIGEVLKYHRALRGRAAEARAVELLGQVGLPDPRRRVRDYPHQLSGGMRQRVMIAIALAGEPDLLIADEPTTALDVTIQAQILALLKALQRETGMALWLITHDLGIVADIADRVAVMQAGKIVEQATRERFFLRPDHVYSRQLLDLLPRLDACRGQPPPEAAPKLLEVRDFKVYYPIRKGVFQRVVDHVRAVDGVSFDVEQGRTVALVGESGCGKTTLGKGILNLIAHTEGAVTFEGIDVASLAGEDRRRLRARMQIVFQDPFSSMNPRMLVGDVVAEGLRALHPGMTGEERRERVEALLESVGLPRAARLRYPHEFSGGQRQRVCIARALAVEPKLIVCDEPTSALDVSVQAHILALLRDLQNSRGLSYLFITHDLGIVAELAHYVAVMHGGRIVEYGATAQVLLEPAHPYTRCLLEAVPRLRRG